MNLLNPLLTAAVAVLSVVPAAIADTTFSTRDLLDTVERNGIVISINDTMSTE